MRIKPGDEGKGILGREKTPANLDLWNNLFYKQKTKSSKLPAIYSKISHKW